MENRDDIGKNEKKTVHGDEIGEKKRKTKRTQLKKTNKNQITEQRNERQEKLKRVIMWRSS